MPEQILITKDEKLNYYIPTEILMPSANGTYNLTTNVNNGEVTYSFDEGGGSGGSGGDTVIVTETVSEGVHTLNMDTAQICNNLKAGKTIKFITTKIDGEAEIVDMYICTSAEVYDGIAYLQFVGARVMDSETNILGRVYSGADDEYPTYTDGSN